jgi:cell division protein ZipA
MSSSVALSIVAVILVLCVLGGLVGMRQQNKTQREQPDLGDFDNLSEHNSEFEDLFAADDAAEDERDILMEDYNEPAPQPAAPPKAESFIMISVMAKPNEPFIGYELLQALLGTGLRYGDMKIFHRHQEANGKGPVLFSLAQVREPGTFDIQKMGAVATEGLTLFMRVNGKQNEAQHLALMLQCARRLADELGGEVCDNRRRPLTAEAIETFQEQVASYQTAGDFEAA